ncbi:hypothetical protein [Wolbachia endosymbiont (group A) of Conops quadrifasciatus]|uniref:hypothetical protein n=1 Tax=Wolbachia endosymbiont (group A) of Conops quadrifasciatus TaxID=3066143 RepID=UPI003132A8FD
MKNNENDMEVGKSFIIYFKNFYKEPKMKTLSIKFADKEIMLKDHQEEISTARDVDIVKKEL